MSHFQSKKKTTANQVYYTQQRYPSEVKGKQIFQDKANLRKLRTTKPALQQLLHGGFRRERKKIHKIEDTQKTYPTWWIQ